MKIAMLPGDGIGVEVLEAVKIVLDKLKLDATYIHGDIGWEFWKKEGDPLPERTIDLLRNVDAAMFGAITSKPASVAQTELEVKGNFTYRSPIVRMRQLFDLYVCKRPCKAYPGNSLNFNDDIDITVFRENTEDLYCGIEFSPVPRAVAAAVGYAIKPESYNWLEVVPWKENDAISIKVNTRKGSQRIVRAAFEYAKENGKESVTVVHKANVVRATDGLFLEEARKVAKEYPNIRISDANIDAMCMWLLKNPLNYQVLVAPNLYGDIVSDLCAQMVGGLGFACSGNISNTLGVFEPTHGSAPKYAGQYKVNPIATILAAKMMLEWLGEDFKAAKVENAVASIIEEGIIKTYDMGGNHSTLEMAAEISRKV
jgi:3-isopropylmalate dehydrogenase